MAHGHLARNFVHFALSIVVALSKLLPTLLLLVQSLLFVGEKVSAELFLLLVFDILYICCFQMRQVVPGVHCGIPRNNVKYMLGARVKN